MNVGIMFPSSRLGGGTFQCALSIIYSLVKYSNMFDYNIIFSNKESISWLNNLSPTDVNYVSISPKKSSLMNKFGLLFKLALNRNILNAQKNENIFQEKNSNIKLLIIPFPSLFGLRNNIPYIVSIPDLMHKYYPDFPEYPLKTRLKRNIIYKNAAKHSVLTVVDADQGLKDLNKFFRIPKEKIRVIPYIPSVSIYEYKNMDLKTVENITEKYHLPKRFLFYPAHFWHHKNHIRLIKSLKLIQQTHRAKIYLILVGYPKESYEKVLNLINKLNMNDQIIHLGYVSDEDLVALYKKAVALVFPSLFGPTNIPPLEAMVLGTPLLCSNVLSMPEQVGDAGLLFDPNNIKDMAKKIYKIWIDNNLTKRLIQKGYDRVKNLTLENYAKQWEQVIHEAVENSKK